MNNSDYIFQSDRLGFRNWHLDDISKMAAINADSAVMEFFPDVQTLSQTQTFIDRMQAQFTEKHFCYFAVDLLEDNAFIGFIGLSEQNFKSNFTPCIDIGWRIASTYWYKGYATEGAKRCLKYAFEALCFNTVFAIAPAINIKSIRIMQKIGMQHHSNFIHPLLIENKRLCACEAYVINNTYK